MSAEKPNDPRLDQASVSDESLLDAHEQRLGSHPDEGARYRLLPIAILFTPVSYTHLDVYKRQSSRNGAPPNEG